MTRLKLTVKTVQGIKYEGEVWAVSAVNERGPFDVLSQHVQFVTEIVGPVVVHESENKKININLKKAILHVKNDVVEIYGKE